MHPDLDNLIALQAQDLERLRLVTELNEAPKRITAAETKLVKGLTALGKAEEALKKEEARRRSLESDAETLRTKTARLRKQLENATTQQQVTAWEHEIAFNETSVSKLEDDELASLERTDTFEAQRVAAASAVARDTPALDAERAAVAALKTGNTAAIAVIDAERARLRAKVSAAQLGVYDRVTKVRGSGVSEGVDHKCSACRMMVRPQRWNDLTDRSQHDAIFTCESCGRLLYYDPRRDAPVQWTPGKAE